MSDNTTSGDTPAAPAASAAETPSAPPASFGTGRGSGLARGKRPSPPSAAPASSAPAGTYKPSAVQLITAETEYTNPFAPAEPAPAAPAAETVPASIPVPPPAPAPAPVAVAPVVPEAVARPSVPVEPIAPPTPPAPAAPVEKAELKILPPAQVRRPAQSWESESFKPGEERTEPRRERREDRPVFKPERRGEFRASPGAEAAPRPPRPPAPPAPAPVREEAPAKKSGGFLGWLKGLFGGSAEPTSETPASGTRPERESGSSGRDGDRRRHRGGRGRQGGPGFEGGPGGRPEGATDGRGGEGRGEGGGGRRRRRGGRGRRGGGPRPEGGPGPASS